MRFVFYEYFGAAEKKTKQTKSKRSLPQFFTRMGEQCAFWQEILLRLGLGLFHQTLLANQDRLNVLSVHGTVARAHGFHFLLVKCGVDHTCRGTSASLNSGRFRGHQVTLK